MGEERRRPSAFPNGGSPSRVLWLSETKEFDSHSARFKAGDRARGRCERRAAIVQVRRGAAREVNLGLVGMTVGTGGADRPARPRRRGDNRSVMDLHVTRWRRSPRGAEVTGATIASEAVSRPEREVDGRGEARVRVSQVRGWRSHRRGGAPPRNATDPDLRQRLGVTPSRRGPRTRCACRVARADRRGKNNRIPGRWHARENRSASAAPAA